MTAPTGAGKTLVAEGAVHLALRAGWTGFLHDPDQGAEQSEVRRLRRALRCRPVGLLTGDNVVNGDAPVVVMTTEVLRNMIYAGSSRTRTGGIGGPGRGPLPPGSLPGGGLGGGDHPRSPTNPTGSAVGDDRQRRGILLVGAGATGANSTWSCRPIVRCLWNLATCSAIGFPTRYG